MSEITVEKILHRTRIHYFATVLVGLVIMPTRYRFDSSWRHADSGPKRWFYILVCTFAANYIADQGWPQIKHWRHYL